MADDIRAGEEWRRRPGVLRQGGRFGAIGCAGCATFIVIATAAIFLALAIGLHEASKAARKAIPTHQSHAEPRLSIPQLRVEPPPHVRGVGCGTTKRKKTGAMKNRRRLNSVRAKPKPGTLKKKTSAARMKTNARAAKTSTRRKPILAALKAKAVESNSRRKRKRGASTLARSVGQ